MKKIALALLVSFLITPLVFADALTFPMTVYGDLKVGTASVPAGAIVSFLDTDNHLLGRMTTNQSGQYGGVSAYDTN